MTKSLITFAAASATAAAVALAAAGPAHADAHMEAGMSDGEKELAELLEGRVAGEPVSCIRTRPNVRMRVIDETAYVYGSGRTIYVQRTRHPDRIDRHDTLVQRRFSGTQLCRQDITTTVDPISGIFTGAVFFDNFVPYTRKPEEG